MKKRYFIFSFTLIFCITFFAGCGSVTSLEAASREADNYEINAVLNYEEKTLTATEKLTYRNDSGFDFTELKFHLYPNAFREEATTFKAVNAIQFSRAYPNGFSEGNINITSVKVNNNEIDFQILNDDKNILNVPLGQTLKNGNSVEVEIVFDLTIPNCNHRFGYGENTLNLGNWYPIVCVFEDGEFFTDGYSPNGDPFYSEVANYVVSITYPNDLTLASTGEIIDETTQDNNITRIYSAKAVRDFALVFSEKFEVITANAGDVAVEYYYYDDENASANLQIAVDAINTFGDMFGLYPYANIKIAEANFLQGGMEYPMLVYISDEIDVNGEYQNAIVHEIAHQWWYGVVGNNECEYAWIDEGLAEYSTAIFYDRNTQYGKTSQEVFASALSSYLLFCDVYREVYDTLDTSMNRNIHNFNTETEYVYLTYVKGVLMYDSIAELIGEDKMVKVLQNFYENNAFKVVEPADLIEAFETVTHRKLASYIMSWLDGSVVIDELNN